MMSWYLDEVVDRFNRANSTFGDRAWTSSGVGPRVRADGDQLTMNFDVPGSKKEDVEVTFEAHDVVKVVSKRADTGTTATWRYVVDDTWDRGAAEAKVEDGVLTIRMCKRERDKPRKLLVK